MSGSPVRVGIIGAGAAGLCATRHFTKCIDSNFIVTVLEQQGHVGGTWKHTNKVGWDENGNRIHSSMYDNLRTNLPKQIMEYPDFPFGDVDGDSFIYHNEVQKYLEDYNNHFDLEKYIKFFRKVEKIGIDASENSNKWVVDVQDVLNKTKEKFIFDALILAIGSYTYPRIPKLPGIQNFKGKIIHSHDYRNNKPYKDSTILVLGAGPSGVDIALELTEVAHKVILCHSGASIFDNKKPDCLEEKCPISELNETCAIFPNGEKTPIDALLLCTGYDLGFNQFLDQECQIKLEDRRASPLYKHYISIEHPNLAILGITFRVVPFPLYHIQSQGLTKFWSGKIKLPTKEDMLVDEAEDFQKRIDLGMPIRYAHILQGELQFEYLNQLAEIANVPKLPPKYEKLYKYCHFLRKTNPVNYKNVKINISEI